MAMELANEATIYLGEMDAVKTVTAASNAAECVLTAAGHGLANGDFVVFVSGWGELSGRTFKVGGVSGNNFNLVGINTADTVKFPAGSGVGSVRKVKKWTQITQVLDLSMQGGDQQKVDASTLESKYEIQIPTVFSAMSFQIVVADDITLPGYKAAVAASNSGSEVPFMFRAKKGVTNVYFGYMSVNEQPVIARNEVMKINMDYSITGKGNRYES